MRKKGLLLGLTLALILLLVYYLYDHQNIPLLTPLGQPRKHQTLNRPKIILGFLPHWNISKLNATQQNHLTHLAYFSLKIDGTGNIQTHTTKVSEEPGFTVYKKLKSYNIRKPFILVFSQADNSTLEELLSNPKNLENARRNILSYSQNASGINIDIEPSGMVTLQQRQAFVDFIKDLYLSLQQSNPTPTLSIDVYPTATSPNKLWDMQALEPYTDYFVVMTYDYFRASSATSGPNSPLRSNPSNSQDNILKNLKSITDIVPSYKILLGIPFYGYEWTTSTTTPYSNTIGTGRVASLQRIDELIREKQLTPLWDSEALTPYLVLQENQKIAQIHYENIHSLSYKLQLVKQADLGGIAIWALGYEGENNLLWETISNSLLNP